MNKKEQHKKTAETRFFYSRGLEKNRRKMLYCFLNQGGIMSDGFLGPITRISRTDLETFQKNLKDMVIVELDDTEWRKRLLLALNMGLRSRYWRVIVAYGIGVLGQRKATAEELAKKLSIHPFAARFKLEQARIILAAYLRTGGTPPNGQS